MSTKRKRESDQYDRWRKKFIGVEEAIISYFKRHPECTPDGSFIMSAAYKYDRRRKIRSATHTAIGNFEQIGKAS